MFPLGPQDKLYEAHLLFQYAVVQKVRSGIGAVWTGVLPVQYQRFEGNPESLRFSKPRTGFKAQL